MWTPHALTPNAGIAARSSRNSGGASIADATGIEFVAPAADDSRRLKRPHHAIHRRRARLEAAQFVALHERPRVCHKNVAECGEILEQLHDPHALAWRGLQRRKHLGAARRPLRQGGGFFLVGRTDQPRELPLLEIDLRLANHIRQHAAHGLVQRRAIVIGNPARKLFENRSFPLVEFLC